MNETLPLDYQVPGQRVSPAWDTPYGNPRCPLTGSRHIQVLEEFSASLLVDCYQRDLGINVAPEFGGVDRLQLCRSLESGVIFFFPMVTGSSKFYHQLRTFDWYYPAAKFEYQRAATWIKSGDCVLDIGCGAAQFAHYIPDARYYGLEPNLMPGDNSIPGGIRILSEKVSLYAREKTQTYDVVCAFQVLEHIADPRSFLTTALACLKPNGLLILGVPNAESYITRIPNFVLNAPPHHFTWWTNDALCRLADQFQLSILDLAHAPVESWETRLYWMQRISGLFSLQSWPRFTESPSRRLFNMAAYLIAGYIQDNIKPPLDARGSTVVMVGKKVQSSMSNVQSYPTQTLNQPLNYEA